MMKINRLTGILSAFLALVLIAIAVVLLVNRNGSKQLTADFPRTISLYEGSSVKILGVPVGTVDSVTPEGTFVKVKLSYDSKYKLPANAKAVVISPSIVGDRFVQLTPAYAGGAALPDNAHLSVNRTATPLELDQIFGSLNNLDVALGPKGANAPGKSGVGALTRLLQTTAANFGGQGAEVHHTIMSLGRLTKTLSDNKGALFGTAHQVERFVHALSVNDKTVRRFSDSLANGSALLAGERHDLASALHNLATTMVKVRGFVHDNRRLLSSNIHGLRRISDTIVARRKELNETLRVAPVAINNLALTYDPNAGTLDARADLGTSLEKGLANPSEMLCTILGSVLPKKQCPVSGNGRPAPFGARTSQQQQFDPTLGGILGGGH